ncbi:hypothetical protein IF650_02515 [Cellulosimicrobium terreum]|nr:hypothetical protein [Cellulosimicrobium terreum]
MTTARPARRPEMVWTRVPGGVRGRERLAPVADFLAVLAILLVLLAAAVWGVVWLVRQGEGAAAAIAAFVPVGLAIGTLVYVRAPLRSAVVLRPADIELPVGRETVVRVVVRWDDVVAVRVLEDDRRATLVVELRDGARTRFVEGEDLMDQARRAPSPDAVVVTDAQAVARVLGHLLEHPGDRARLADRVGVGIVLAFVRPVHGTPER